MTKSNDNNKKVCFNNVVTVKEIPTHREWTHNERLSVWYTGDDYRQFNIAENHECASGSTSSRIEHIQRSRRIEDVRYLVLRAQHVQRKIAKNNAHNCCCSSKKEEKEEQQRYKEDHSKWLSEFYQQNSKQSVIAARKRGLENDLWLLDIKLREASLMLSKHSILFNNLNVSDTSSTSSSSSSSSISSSSSNSSISSSNSSNKNGSSAIEGGNSNNNNNNNNKRSANSFFNDYSPNSEKSKRKLHQLLCKDFNSKRKVNPIFSPTSEIVALESNISPFSTTRHDQQQERWSANGRTVDTNKKDLLPFRPMRQKTLSNLEWSMESDE